MLLGLSLLGITASILVYRHPPSSWRRLRPSPATSDEGDGRGEPVRAGGENLTNARHDDSQRSNLASRNTSSADSSDSSDTTPTPSPATKAKLQASTVPRLQLDDSEDDEDEDGNMPPPAFPSMNSAQRARTSNSLQARQGAQLPPAPKTSMSSTLMPPPPKPRSTGTSPSPLRTFAAPRPTNGPLPNRSPVAGMGGLGVPLGAPPKPSKASRKVQLSPGHSPLDWARLQKSGANLSGVDSMQRVTPSQLKAQNGRKGRPAWSSYRGKVYNITPYLPFHPGGEGELRRAAGKDGEKLFMEIHQWVNWDNMLGDCLVGILVGENEASNLEEINLESLD